MKINYSNLYIQNVLKDVKTIAVVGASPKKHKESYKVVEFLYKYGFKLFLVNPNEINSSIFGLKFYANLKDINDHIDMIDVFRVPEALMDITRDAIKIQANILWTQENIINDEAARLAEDAGIKVIMDRCPKKELSKPYWTTKTK